MTRSTSLSAPARAFLDALADGESGGLDDDEAYSVLFGGGHFPAPPWPTAFPVWSGVWIDGVPTHAAGRYQFEPATARSLSMPDFSPESQDEAAWNLASQVYRVRSGKTLESALGGGQLDAVAIALRSTWTSLSPNTLPIRYVAALVKLAPFSSSSLLQAQNRPMLPIPDSRVQLPIDNDGEADALNAAELKGE